MPGIIFDPTARIAIETLLAVILGIVIVLALVRIFGSWRNLKLADTELLSIEQEVQERKFRQDRKLVEHVQSIVLRLKNNSMRPIKFAGDAAILSAEIGTASQHQIAPKLSVENNKVVIKPLSLNQQDFIEVVVYLNATAPKRGGTSKIVKISSVTSNFILKAISVIALVVLIYIIYRAIDPSTPIYLVVAYLIAGAILLWNREHFRAK